MSTGWQLGEPLCKKIYKIPSHRTNPYKGQKEGKKEGKKKRKRKKNVTNK